MQRQTNCRLKEERGASIVEYIPIITLFLLISVPSLRLTGEAIQLKLCEAKQGMIGVPRTSTRTDPISGLTITVEDHTCQIQFIESAPHPGGGQLSRLV
jgi:hypothetical protein